MLRTCILMCCGFFSVAVNADDRAPVYLFGRTPVAANTAARVTPSVVASVPANTAARVTPTAVASVPVNTATRVTPSAVASVPANTAARVTPTAVASVSANTAARVTPTAVASVPGNTATRVTPSAVASVPANTAARVTPTAVASVPANTVARVTPTAVASVSANTAARVTPTAVASVPANTAARVTPTAVASVPANTATRVTPSAVASVPVNTAARITPSVFTFTPPNTASLVAPRTTVASSLPAYTANRASTAVSSVLKSLDTSTPTTDGNVWLLVDTKAHKIEVKKGEQTLEVLQGIAIGRKGAGLKTHRGDDITPQGNYRIGWVGERSNFRKFFGLTYPSTQDAEIGLKRGIISEQEYSRIKAANEYNQIPPQNTALGGQIGIHGLGAGDLRVHEAFDWTHGCIALTNSQIDQLSQWLDTGTVVKIR